MTRTTLFLISLPLGLAFAQDRAPAVRVTLVPVSATESLRVTDAGAGEPIVLLPGLFGAAFGYRHLLALLPAAGYRAIVIEPLGIGGSPRPRGADYSLSAQAERLSAVLERLHLPAATIVAHSVGVSLALRLAWRHPDRVRAVVALDGGAAETATTPGFRRAMRYAPWIKWLGGVKRVRPRMRKDLLAASGDGSWVTEAVMDGYTAAATADLDGTLMAFLAMAEARETERLVPHLSDIHCPVRLIVGTAPHAGGVEDKQVRVMRDRLPDFSVDSVAGAGQYLFEEQPGALARLIQGVAHGSATALGTPH